MAFLLMFTHIPKNPSFSGEFFKNVRLTSTHNHTKQMKEITLVKGYIIMSK